MERIAAKIDSAGAAVPAPVVQLQDGARIGLVSLGSCDAAIREAVDLLADAGVPVDYMRVRGFPFSARVDAFLLAHEVVFVIEQNRDGQLRSLLLLETSATKERLRSIRALRRAAAERGGRGGGVRDADLDAAVLRGHGMARREVRV
jgi:2-oxoglutarate/2-oxoacid ferredoxin oxidoreductase subunit alpha